MKKTFLVMSVVALFLASISLFTRIKSETRQENESYAEDYVPNELLVKFDNDIGKYAIQDAINYLQGKVISYLGSELNPDAWGSFRSLCSVFQARPQSFAHKSPRSCQY